MGNVETLRSDGTLHGAVTHIAGAVARNEVAKMICIIIPKNGGLPVIAFCQTDTLAEELGLLDIAKIQALTTRNIIVGG